MIVLASQNLNDQPDTHLVGLIVRPSIWYSILSKGLKRWHPIGAPVLVTLLPVQILANVSRKVIKDGPSTWASANHMADPAADPAT